MFSLQLLEFFLFIGVATSATLQPLILPSNVPSSIPSTTNNSLNGGYSPRYHCNPRAYPEANEKSCELAARLIQGTRTRVTFTQRENRGLGVSLPYNWVSDDARCIVTLYLAAAVDEGVTDGRNVRDTAYHLLDRCIRNEGRGGMVTSFEQQSPFTITMEPYRPSISCARQTGPPLHSCEVLLANMAAHQQPLELFGDDAGTRPSIPLPWTIANVDERCMIVIDSKDRKVTTASWFELWEAATAVTARCVRGSSRSGRISNLGANRKMFITMLDEGQGNKRLQAVSANATLRVGGTNATALSSSAAVLPSAEATEVATA